ncbi:hypothetical protein [Paenibacillus prosopidis]|uniref:Uncharacterized protein n=1 Tax=Paenibacillus prosopidis TaxID=630520 RepID=A0A368VS44_9BACL|nr:hypothetical protein [Paenibacillus prosopidis]RCW42263.1 hypothetical protein DFP97_11892 [Paenibacillus prosopidis]
MIAQIGLYIVFVTVMSLVRIQSLLRKQQKKEAALYGGLMTVCAVLGSLLLAGVAIPSLVVPYEMIFQPIGKMILGK